jgi:hypothetical protein
LAQLPFLAPSVITDINDTPFLPLEVQDLERQAQRICPPTSTLNDTFVNIDHNHPSCDSHTPEQPIITLDSNGLPMEIYSFHSADNVDKYIESHNSLITYSLLADKHDDEPKSLAQALKTDEASDWMAAAVTEIESLMQHGTWQLTTRPPGKRVLKTRWVFKRKLTSAGKIARYKARLQGFSATGRH